MKNKKFVKGFLWLAAAGAISKVIGAAYRIPLTNFLGAEGIGLYQMAFPVFAFIICLAHGGASVVMSREIAYERAARQRPLFIAKQGMLLFLCFSIIFSILLFFLSSSIANFQEVPALAPIYKVASICVLLSTIGCSLRSVFVGYEKMGIVGTGQVFQQAIKLIFGLLLGFIMSKNGAIQGALGAFYGILIAEAFNLAYLAVAYIILSKKENRIKNIDFTETKAPRDIFIKIFIESLPITIGVIILPLSTAFESLFAVKLLTMSGFSSTISTSLFGIWSGVVTSLINLPSVVAIAAATAIVPSIGFSLGEKDNKQFESKAKFSLGLVFIFTMFCGLMFLLFPNNIIKLLYTGGFNLGSTLDGTNIAIQLLKYASPIIIFMSILQCLSAVLQSCKKSGIAARNIAIGVAIKIILTLVLVSMPNVNIWGLLIGTVAMFLTSATLNLISISKMINLKKSIGFVAKIFLITIITFVSVYFLMKFLTNFKNIFQLAIGAFVTFSIFALMLVMFFKNKIKFKSKTNGLIKKNK